MTRQAWRDTATGKIYKVNKVEDAATGVLVEMSFEEVCALVDEQYSKAELIKILANRRNVYDIARLLLIKRLEQIEINISRKWIDINEKETFCSRAVDYIKTNIHKNINRRLR